MPSYRAVVVGKNGNPSGTHDFDAFGDEDAIVRAGALADGHSVELWDIGRLVMKIDAKADKSSRSRRGRA